LRRGLQGGAAGRIEEVRFDPFLGEHMRASSRYIVFGTSIFISAVAVVACSSSSNDGGGGKPASDKIGDVSLFSVQTSTSASASFTSQGKDICQENDSFVACRIFTCPPADGGDPVATGGIPYSAGAITLSGGKIPGGSVTLQPKADKTYDLLQLGSTIWSGGESIIIRAAGDPNGVPAYSATLTAPMPLTLTAPTWSDGGELSFDTTRDLTLTWSPLSSGQVNVFLLGTAQGQDITGSCTFDATTPGATLSKAFLSQFPAGAEDGFFEVNVSERAAQTVADWNIYSGLSQDAIRAGGGTANTSGGSTTVVFK